MPLSVLEKAQSELLCLPDAGASVLEISHRSKAFVAIMESAQNRIRRLLGASDDFEVLMLQGGSRLQFSMIPMNLMSSSGGTADYITTGSWGKAALGEASKVGKINVAWDGAEDGYSGLPTDEQLQLSSDSAFVYFTSNETIEGVQFPAEPEVGERVLVCDASSDFLHRPIPMDRYGIIYACAQKNAGPAGVTVVVIRKDLLERSGDELPGYLNFKTHAAKGSMFNTPPTFAVYLVDLVAQWLEEEIGGLNAMHQQNQAKAKLLYDVLDSSEGFYCGHAKPEARSIMNVTFRLPDDDAQAAFLSEAEQVGLCNLKGHRSVGGIRASVYNAMPVEGVQALAKFMTEFRQSRG